jgi:hypothetical protein
MLVAETSQIEYVSTNQDRAAPSTGYTCQFVPTTLPSSRVSNHITNHRYLVAVHDRQANTITFRSAPLYDLTRTVKALKNLEPQAVSQAQRGQARNVLGETFGTKKAKAAIRAAERNRVDVTAMKDVQDFVVESVRGGTSALPTKGQQILCPYAEWQLTVYRRGGNSSFSDNSTYPYSERRRYIPLRGIPACEHCSSSRARGYLHSVILVRHNT